MKNKSFEEEVKIMVIHSWSLRENIPTSGKVEKIDLPQQDELAYANFNLKNYEREMTMMFNNMLLMVTKINAIIERLNEK